MAADKYFATAECVTVDKLCVTIDMLYETADMFCMTVDKLCVTQDVGFVPTRTGPSWFSSTVFVVLKKSTGRAGKKQRLSLRVQIVWCVDHPLHNRWTAGSVVDEWKACIYITRPRGEKLIISGGMT